MHMRKPMSKPLRTENNLSRSSPAEYNKNFPWKSKDRGLEQFRTAPVTNKNKIKIRKVGCDYDLRQSTKYRCEGTNRPKGCFF